MLMNSSIGNHVTPDHSQSNGFGREYIQSQLEQRATSHGLTDLKEELDEFVSFYPEADVFNITSPWLIVNLGRIASGNVSHSLVAKNENGDYSTDDGLFENVLQAHHYELSQNTEVFAPMFREYVDEFSSRVKELVSAGTLPETVIDRLVGLTNVNFAIGDNYKEVGVLAETIHNGNDYSSTDMIAYPASINSDGSLDKSTVFHELVHVIGEEAREGLTEFLRQVLPDKRAAADIAFQLEEGLTEHLALVISGMRDINDTTIDLKDPVYVNERQFLTDLNSRVPAIEAFLSAYLGGKIIESDIERIRDSLSGDMNMSNYFNLGNYDAQDDIFKVNI
jgi:hypothetical protein